MRADEGGPGQPIGCVLSASVPLTKHAYVYAEVAP